MPSAATARSHDPDVIRAHNVNEAVAAEVRAAMGRRRVTQTQLAARLHLSQPAVSRRLHGEISFNVEELVTVADMLGVTVSDLVRAASPCFSPLSMPNGQMELALGLDPPLLLAA